MQQFSIRLELQEQPTIPIGHPSFAHAKAPRRPFDCRPLKDGLPLLRRIRDMVGGTTTIFLDDHGIAGSVPGPRLAPGSAHDAVLHDGRPWRGDAEILGAAAPAACDPIRDGPGQVVDALCVSLPRAEDTAAVLAALTWWLGRSAAQRLLQPLGVIEKIMA